MELKILDKDTSLYTLEDENKNVIKVQLDFMDIEKEPVIGEYICMNEELLNPRYEGYSTFYAFGNLENQYGKENISMDDVDVIKLIIEEKEIYLKRLYG